VIDANRDLRLSKEEIRAAWRDRATSQFLSGLIVRYESEWGIPAAEWDTLDDLMSKFGPTRNWMAEKQRIAKLRWWDKVKGHHGFPASHVVYHFHPLAVIGNFARIVKHPVIVVDGVKIELEFLEFNDGMAITETDYQIAAQEIGCEVAIIKAIAQVESGKYGAYSDYPGWDKVPVILFERHIFHKYTNGQYDTVDQNISCRSLSKSGSEYAYPHVDGYWTPELQYKRLLKAYTLNKSAALKSCSWGRYQLMGFNHQVIPFKTVEEMVLKFGKSESWHLKGFVKFVKSDSVLRNAAINKNWVAFAEKYNGTGYRIYQYDTKMEQAYNAITSTQH
jgi:hypothetical protein